MGYTPVDERLKYDTPADALDDGKHVYESGEYPTLSCPHDERDVRVVQLFNFCPSCAAQVNSSTTVRPTGKPSIKSECEPI